MKRMNHLSVQREIEHPALQAYAKKQQDSPSKTDWNADLSPAKAKPYKVLQTLRENDHSLRKVTEKDGSLSEDSLQTQLAQLKIIKEASPGRLLAEHKPT